MSSKIDLRSAAIGAAAGLLILAVVGGSVAVVRWRLSAPAAAVVVSPSPSTTAPTAEGTPSPSPSGQTPLQHAAATATCPAGERIRSAADLHQAMASAQPGTVIVMAAGTYSDKFEAKVSGTAQSPITLCGPSDAVIDGGDIKNGYAFYLNTVDWWRVIGFSIQGAQKGVVADHSHHLLIQGLTVHDVGDEGIHLREFSTDNVVDGNTVYNTGLHSAKFGEGIYVGTANGNWCKYTNCNVDTSDRNVVRNNTISHTTAENIDIKEGTTGGVIENNHLSGDGMTAASAWLNMKGNDWTIVGNDGMHSPKDGFQVHNVYNGWGERNVFHGNRAEVDGPGYGYYMQSVSLATVFTCDNSAVGAGRGLSNEHCA